MSRDIDEVRLTGLYMNATLMIIAAALSGLGILTGAVWMLVAPGNNVLNLTLVAVAIFLAAVAYRAWAISKLAALFPKVTRRQIVRSSRGDVRTILLGFIMNDTGPPGPGPTPGAGGPL
jgi:hypothetical protein